MDTLRIHVVTWNVACKPPDGHICLDQLLGLDDPRNLTPDDVYIVGLQEVKAHVQNMVLDALFDDPWTQIFKTKLAEKDFIKIRTVRLQGLVMSLFVQRRRLLSVRDVAWELVRTGLGGLWGNKGATSIRFAIGGVSICLVNSHLTPHDHNLDARVNDYNAIVQQMRFPKHKPTEMILFHDYVIWLGDHNFRLDESVNHEEALSRIKNDELEWLLEKDQLKEVMRNGMAFSELTEPDFRFPPTFKFVMNSSEYDNKRRPAWTDRILYRVTENAYENLTLSVQVDKYSSLPQYSQSDHKPVIGRFRLKTIADHEDRLVQFAPIQVWHIDRPNEIIISLGDDVKPHDFDWVGVYKADFSSLDEYLTFLYINPRSIDEESHGERRSGHDKRIVISSPDHILRGTGDYCLLYITEDWGSVLGISNIFNAQYATAGVRPSPSSRRRRSYDSDHSSYPPLISPSPSRTSRLSPSRYSLAKRRDHSSSDSDSH